MVGRGPRLTGTAPEWIGGPLSAQEAAAGQGGERAARYGGFSLDAVAFAVGDCVLTADDDEPAGASVARIVGLFEAADGVKRMEVRWFYRYANCFDHTVLKDAEHCAGRWDARASAELGQYELFIAAGTYMNEARPQPTACGARRAAHGGRSAAHGGRRTNKYSGPRSLSESWGLGLC